MKRSQKKHKGPQTGRTTVTTPNASAPPRADAPPAAPVRAPEKRDRVVLRQRSFVVGVEGFTSVHFKRVGAYDTATGELRLTRDLTADDHELAAWFGAADSRRVMLHVLNSRNEAVRGVNLGKCHPVSYFVGPFDEKSDEAAEETLTIRQDDPPVYRKPEPKTAQATESKN